jgi:hypothetical protein
MGLCGNGLDFSTQSAAHFSLCGSGFRRAGKMWRRFDSLSLRKNSASASPGLSRRMKTKDKKFYGSPEGNAFSRLFRLEPA